MSDLLWSSRPSTEKERKKKVEAKRKLGKEKKNRMALCLVCWRPEWEVNTWSPQRGKSPLLMLSCRIFLHHSAVAEKNFMSTKFSHFAIAFLAVLAPHVKRDQYIQQALFHRLNCFFSFPKRMNVFILHPLNSLFKGAFWWSWQHKKPSRTAESSNSQR